MRIPILIAVLAGLVFAPHPVWSDAFLAGFEDVPVMPGITVDDEAAVSFDTPAGRIVEAYAAGDVSPESVRQFYDAALPQLGWRRIDDLTFHREGETLTVELLRTAPAVTIRFRLAPAAR